MRKLVLIILIVAIIAVMFTACDGNEDNFSGYSICGDAFYSYAYINIGGDSVNVEISRWGLIDGKDNIVYLKLKDGTTLMVDAENCILYNGTLPTGMTAFEQKVIEDACNELNVSTQGATLTLVSSEYVAWLDCEVNNYILTLADGSRWLVGARENADGFYCDVECEIV